MVKLEAGDSCRAAGGLEQAPTSPWVQLPFVRSLPTGESVQSPLPCLPGHRVTGTPRDRAAGPAAGPGELCGRRGSGRGLAGAAPQARRAAAGPPSACSIARLRAQGRETTPQRFLTRSQQSQALAGAGAGTGTGSDRTAPRPAGRLRRQRVPSSSPEPDRDPAGSRNFHPAPGRAELPVRSPRRWGAGEESRRPAPRRHLPSPPRLTGCHGPAPAPLPQDAPGAHRATAHWLARPSLSRQPRPPPRADGTQLLTGGFYCAAAARPQSPPRPAPPLGGPGPASSRRRRPAGAGARPRS